MSKWCLRLRCGLATDVVGRLQVVQQPRRARMCGFGDKVHITIPTCGYRSVELYGLVVERHLCMFPSTYVIAATVATPRSPRPPHKEITGPA
jgi:hypothetical protein